MLLFRQDTQELPADLTHQGVIDRLTDPLVGATSEVATDTSTDRIGALDLEDLPTPTYGVAALLSLMRAVRAGNLEELTRNDATLDNRAVTEEVVIRSLARDLFSLETDKAQSTIDALHVPQNLVRAACLRAMLKLVRHEPILSALRLVGWNHEMMIGVVQEPEVQEACRKRLAALARIPPNQHSEQDACDYSVIRVFYQSQGATELDREAIPPLSTEDRAALFRAFHEGEYTASASLGDIHGLRHATLDAEIVAAFWTGMVNAWTSGHPHVAEQLVAIWCDSNLAELRPELLPNALANVVQNFGISSALELVTFAVHHPAFIARCCVSGDELMHLRPEHLEKIDTLGIHADEAEALLSAGITLDQFGDPPNFAALANALHEHSAAWQDEANVWGPFERAVRVFGEQEGAAAIFALLSTASYSRHYALHDFDVVVKLFRTSQLPEVRTFTANILTQCAADTSRHRDPTRPNDDHTVSSFDLLKLIGSGLNPAIEETFAAIRAIPNLPADLAAAAARLDSRKEIFSSWANLRRFMDLEALALDKGLENLLLEIGQSLSPSGSAYLTSLLTCRRLPVSATKQMFATPETFWSRSDRQDPYGLHPVVRPGEWFTHDHIRLTGRDLLNALTEGTVDKVQVFPATKVRYFAPVGGTELLTVREALKRALGSRAQKIPGLARKPGALFTQVQKILRAHGTTVNDYLAGAGPHSRALSDEVNQLLVTSDAGMPLEQLTAFTAVLHRKSDPDSVRINALMPHCMTPDNGKFHEYHLGSGAALFSFFVEGTGDATVYASSVVTRTIEVGSCFNALTKQQRSRAHDIGTHLPLETANSAHYRFVLDNVELGSNRMNGKDRGIISQAYRDFFIRYVKHNGTQLRCAKDHILIGHSHEEREVLEGVEPCDNTTIPSMLFSYSDAWGQRARKMSLGDDVEPLLRTTEYEDTAFHESKHLEGNESCSVPSRSGIVALHDDSAIELAALESRIYADNAELILGAGSIQNSLQASAYSRAIFDLPNLSMASYSDNGDMQGYLLAFLGRFGTPTLPRLGLPAPDSPIVYIEDLAVLPQHKGAGLSLMRAFAERYVEHYGTYELAIPIFVQLRESSTFRVVGALAARLGRLTTRSGGFTFATTTVCTESAGNDTLHHVLLIPQRITSDEKESITLV